MEKLSAYHDWQLAFDNFFENMPNLSIIELGKGEGTRYLCKKFKQVISIEYSRYPFTCSWEKDGLPNHHLETIQTTSNIAALDDTLIRSNGKIRPKELKIEAQVLYDATQKYSADVLFIDHGCHNRGEVLELAKSQKKFLYIVIHDSNSPYYGYILDSTDHEVKNYTYGEGTVFFKRHPLITVIIPSIIRPTLSKSLKSLYQQSNNCWLAKVGIDGLPNTNELQNIIDTYKEDNKIEFNFLEKLGGGKNFGGGVRNKLMENCTTSWMCFLDDDDTFRNTYMDKFISELSANPGCDVILFRMSYDTLDENVLPPNNHSEITPDLVGISFAVRTEFLKSNQIQFKNGPREDFDILTSIRDKGGKICFSNHITYNIRY